VFVLSLTTAKVFWPIDICHMIGIGGSFLGQAVGLFWVGLSKQVSMVGDGGLLCNPLISRVVPCIVRHSGLVPCIVRYSGVPGIIRNSGLVPCIVRHSGLVPRIVRHTTLFYLLALVLPYSSLLVRHTALFYLPAVVLPYSSILVRHTALYYLPALYYRIVRYSFVIPRYIIYRPLYYRIVRHTALYYLPARVLPCT